MFKISNWNPNHNISPLDRGLYTSGGLHVCMPEPADHNDDLLPYTIELSLLVLEIKF